MLFALVWILVALGSGAISWLAIHFLGLQYVMFCLLVFLVVRSID